MPPAVRAFTLIELLVVITIIVVLLALLTPALDQAIYQAELAVCGARLDAVASSLVMYAMDHQRAYPRREFTMENRQPHKIRGQDQKTSIWLDERTQLRGYIALNKMLNDPMATIIELEDTDAGAKVFAGYALWVGWRNVDTSGRPLQGMFRLGNRWEWNDRTYNILVNDYDEYGSTPFVNSPHPDRDATMAPLVLQNQGGVADVTGNAYLSQWRRYANARGPLDLNFAYDDGSVRRLIDVKPNDERQTVIVPQYANSPNLAINRTDYTRVPK